MRSLYDILNESILDSDDKAKSLTSLAPVIEILSSSPYWKFCKYKIKGDDLYVTRKKEYTEFKTFKFTITNNTVFSIVENNTNTIDVSSLNNIHFTNCVMEIYLNNSSLTTSKFLSNCTGCIIHVRDNRYVKQLAELMKNTKKNTVKIDSTVHYDNGKTLYADYGFLNGLDFGSCEVLLNNCAQVETIKNLKVDRLILQTWNYYKDIKFNAGDAVKDVIEKFLNDNSIKSLGIIDTYIQYIDWIVRRGNNYEWISLKADSKRIPKI